MWASDILNQMHFTSRSRLLILMLIVSLCVHHLFLIYQTFACKDNNLIFFLVSLWLASGSCRKIMSVTFLLIFRLFLHSGGDIIIDKRLFLHCGSHSLIHKYC